MDSLLAQQQTGIGWANALNRWLTTEWQAQQEAYWAQWKQKKSSHRWVSALIKKLWDIAWDMWEHQNKALHSSETHRDNILDSSINEQVQALYARGLQAVPQDAFSMFRESLATLLSKPSQYIEHWVTSVKAAMQQKQ